jgi:hypothetical protein
MPSAVADALLPAPVNPAHPPQGFWGNAGRFAYDALGLGDVAKALRGQMTPTEAQDFAFGAALGLIPMSRGLKPVQKGIKAYHGSPHDFDRFDMSKIGTGEGAQAYGHGLYFAENPAVAADYKSKLSTLANVNQSAVDSNALYYLQRNKFDKAAARAELEDALRMKLPDGHPSIQAINSYNPGKMYEVNINAHPDQFLDWDKPLSKQSPAAQSLAEYAMSRPGARGFVADAEKFPLTGQDLHNALAGDLRYNASYNSQPLARASEYPLVSEKMREAGIPGIKYLDQGSRDPRPAYRGDPAFLHAAESFKGSGSDAQATIAGMQQAYKNADPAQIRAAVNEVFDIQPPQTSNYVVFDDKLIDILKKYGLAALGLPPAMTAGSQIWNSQTQQ